jgi:hypothetical protein
MVDHGSLKSAIQGKSGCFFDAQPNQVHAVWRTRGDNEVHRLFPSLSRMAREVGLTHPMRASGTNARARTQEMSRLDQGALACWLASAPSLEEAPPKPMFFRKREGSHTGKRQTSMSPPYIVQQALVFNGDVGVVWGDDNGFPTMLRATAWQISTSAGRRLHLRGASSS